MNAIVKVENVGMAFDTKKGRFVALKTSICRSAGRGRVPDRPLGLRQSTLLNLIAGLTLPTSGVMLCNGREIAGPGPSGRWCSRTTPCCPG
jgi:nitrate/nitrite transport system ATP-binding protein